MMRKSSAVTARAKMRDHEVVGIEDFRDADIEAVRRAGPSKDAEF